MGLLSHNSAFFTANIKNDPDSMTVRSLGPHIRFDGEQFTIAAAREFVQFLYTRTIPSILIDITVLEATQITAWLEHLAHAYIFGEFVRNAAFTAAIMDSIVVLQTQVELYEFPSSMIALVYRHTAVYSPMRRFLADMVAFNMPENANVTLMFRDLPKEYVVDVVAGMVKARALLSGDYTWTTHLMQDLYHVEGGYDEEEVSELVQKNDGL